MAYIEKKYREKINEIFEGLIILEKDLIFLLNKKSIQISNEAAQLCANFNKNINLILKQYYPEIKGMDDKLSIKSSLKFYFDLIDKLTDLVRNIENYQKLDDAYYESIIDFVGDKDTLISGKYKSICSQELTVFYDPASRENLERIILEKIATKKREFFTFGSLEEEIKKIGKIAGAEGVRICSIEGVSQEDLFETAQSVIDLELKIQDNEKLITVKTELKDYLESKGYEVKLLSTFLLTSAKLLPDDKIN